MWGNCLGSLGEVASTSLHSWQHILNEAICNCTKAHPERDPSPGNPPLMLSWKLKSPSLQEHRNIWDTPFPNSDHHSEKAQEISGWYLSSTLNTALCTSSRKFYLCSRVLLCALHELSQADFIADWHGLKVKLEDFPASGCIWQWHVDNSVYSPRPQQGLQRKHHSKSYSTSRKLKNHNSKTTPPPNNQEFQQKQEPAQERQ